MTNSAPRAEKRPIERTFHGDTVVDNYEWLRGDETAARELVDAENAWFAQRTSHLGDLEKKIVGEIAARTKEADVTVPVRKGGYWYWTRTFEGKSYPAFSRTRDTGVRPDPETIGDAEQVIYDANELAEGKEFFSIGGQAVSPNGELIALAVDNAGNEEFDLTITRIDTGEVVDSALSKIVYGLVFSPDSQRIYYTRADAAWRSYQIWEHVIGSDPATDRLLYQEDDEKFSAWMWGSRDGQWLIIHSASTMTSEVRLLNLADAGAEPFVVCERRAGLDYTVEVAGDQLLLWHNLTNVGFEVASAPIGASAPESWTSVMPAATGERIMEVAAFADFAVVLLRAEGSTTLRVLRREEAAGAGENGAPASGWSAPEAIDAPELSSIELGENPQWDAESVLFVTESLLDPVTTNEWTAATGEVRALKVLDVPGYDRSKYVQVREWATAEDGTQIPMTVVYRADLERDGSNPGFLYGYGSYEISIDPFFAANRLPIFDRGIVYAIAHIRGGGEMGREWYEDGKFDKKKYTFSDFVAAAHHLFDTGLVDPARLAAEGRSAGGLLMGAITNLAPETFRVVHAGVPFVDALNTILKPELPLTVGEWEEWGNPIESEHIYRYMKEYSPYENVREGALYPAILATTSLNDVRVSYLEPTKWVQVLRDNVVNDEVERPIVQLTETVAGHGGGSGRYKKWEDRARELAFIFDQLGITE
ncbi:oligopeptidase B [Arcanobacterium wilhelmae]|uniref:Oligopeptidase B n=1 Tax=Arcanobacterium wilhelmae TaxID=1803177 RepID=A0ABT9NB91_9ACTO|nr:S9 family peptidase [Arcanobacterium wilhelmae]MDP9800966.1 oligopeptidase B [Arcanobacterium wilhelmae]WFN90326.1 S9 family peptidase [Arcanobacterium wilhelmae]